MEGNDVKHGNGNFRLDIFFFKKQFLVVGRYDYLSIRYRRYKTKKLHYGHLHNCVCMCKQNIKKKGIFVQIMLLLFSKLLVELKKEYAIFLSLCILSLK